jgi:hypothetical protein
MAMSISRIKKIWVTHMIKIKIHYEWDSDPKSVIKNILKSSKNKSLTYKNLKIVEDDDDADFFVVFSKPSGPHKIDKKRTILFQCEPKILRSTWGEWALPSKEDFYMLYDIETYRAIFPSWYSNMSFDDIVNKKIIKSKSISTITSNKSSLYGHQIRLKFLNLLDTLESVDIYGRGYHNFIKNYRGELSEKYDGMFDYMYHFASENYNEPGWYTEKLTDAIITESLCFWWGNTDRIYEYVDKNSFIYLDIVNDPQGSLDTIKYCIKNNIYADYKDNIIKMKNHLLYEDNPLNIIHKILS